MATSLVLLPRIDVHLVRGRHFLARADRGGAPLRRRHAGRHAGAGRLADVEGTRLGLLAPMSRAQATAVADHIAASPEVGAPLAGADLDRTQPRAGQDEVSASLRSPLDFLAAPPALLRDSDRFRRVGLTVRDGRYRWARWPGDAHRFAHELVALRHEPHV